jgi:hypothetical protein
MTNSSNGSRPDLMPPGVLAGAKAAFQLFTCYQAAGFTKEEAFSLIKDMLTESMKNGTQTTASP